MGLSEAHSNSAFTNGSYELRAAVEVREIPDQRVEHDRRVAAGLYAMTPNWEVVGECGHRLTVINGNDTRVILDWEQRIVTETRHRKRCFLCTKES